jgi:hypothetical protein
VESFLVLQLLLVGGEIRFRPNIPLSLTSIPSFSGLLAARVLSDHFEHVAIIEPDLELDEKRTRVGQWNQGHGLSHNHTC